MQHSRPGVVSRDGNGGLERERAGVHGHAAEHLLLSLGQQAVAPVHGCRQRLVPVRGRPIAASQQPEAVIEPRGQVVQAQ